MPLANRLLKVTNNKILREGCANFLVEGPHHCVMHSHRATSFKIKKISLDLSASVYFLFLIFNRVLRIAQNGVVDHMRHADRSFPTPVLRYNTNTQQYQIRKH